jgi:hypothetical protein
VRAGNDEALRWASRNGHLDVSAYLELEIEKLNRK